MRHRKSKVTLDRTSKQRRPLLRNLVVSLVTHERIVTTAARARVTRSLAERMITIGKKNTLHNRRQLIKHLVENAAVNKILTTLGPRYASRPGGYTRQTKMTPRAGDGAQRVLVELIQE